MTGIKFFIIDGVLVLSAVLMIIFSGFSAFASECEHKPEEVLRLHILANSDSAEDQNLKYRLRDNMLVHFGEVFSDCECLETAVARAKEYREEMEATAQQYIYSMGYDYKVTCEIADTYFTTRCYENYTLPAGNYTAVRFLIGEAKGKNWWCVMFPPLCLPACDGGLFTDEQSKEIEKSEKVEVRFALFEMITGWFDSNNDDSTDKEQETDNEESCNNESKLQVNALDFLSQAIVKIS